MNVLKLKSVSQQKPQADTVPVRPQKLNLSVRKSVRGRTNA